MKFFGNSKDEKNKKTVLFVCIQNAGRSQIAEAFFRKYAPTNYEGISAGTEPVVLSLTHDPQGLKPCAS